MHLNYIAFAVPLFIFFIALEYHLSKRKKLSIHTFNESIANLNVGIAERLCDLLTTGAFYYVFLYINKHFGLFSIKNSVVTWIALLFFTDFLWYWYHRFGHEVNLFWSAHVVHHQSEDFNYTVSARITVLQAVIRGLFWSILPLIGFPAEMITTILLIHGAYPFFTHTQLVGKLGWLEKILVTPSHHRVHHSSNDEYLDKNYGDIFIFWDKLFGTYAQETVTPIYGLTKPLNSYSFLWQHSHFILEMIVALRLANGFKQKWKVLFGKPNAINPKIRPYLERKLLSRNSYIQPTENLKKVIRAQTILTLLILFVATLFSSYLFGLQTFYIAIFIFISVINTGAMIEQKKWVFHLEFLRLIVLALFINTFQHFDYVLVATIGLIVVTIVFYRTIQKQYTNMIYEFF